jgi:shikimate kinase
MLLKVVEGRKGTGVAWGAISIVNAISTGFGAAVSVDFRTVAEATPCEGCETALVNRDQVGDDSLVREVVATIVGALGVEGVGFRIVTRSDIPIAVGLKSSSSAAVAVGRAVLDALGRRIDTPRFLQLIAVRRDLKIGRGKTAAQVAHASLTSYLEVLKRGPDWAEEWLR